MSKQKTAYLASLALLALANVAQALPIVVGGTYEVSDRNGNVWTPNPDNGFFTAVTFSLNGGAGIGAGAGEFALDYRNYPSSDAWTPFLTFCLQPDVFLRASNGTFDENPYTANTLSGAGYDQARVGELWGRFFGQIANPTNGRSNDVNAAAFQVALWELSYGDRNGNLGLGSFTLTSGGDVQTVAQGWLNALNGQGPTANLLVLVDRPGGADRQDLLVKVPEPDSLALLSLGLLGLLGLGRSKRAAIPA